MPASDFCRRNGVIDGNRSERGRLSRKKSRGRGRPTRSNRFRQRRNRQRDFRWRIRERKFGKMRGQRLLQKASKRMRRQESLVRAAKRQQPVGIDRFKTHGKFLCSSLNHPRKKKTGIVVGNNEASLSSQRLKQTSPCASRRLDIRIIEDAPRATNRGVMRHPV